MAFSLLDPLFLNLIDKLKTPEYLPSLTDPNQPSWMIANRLMNEIDPSVPPMLTTVSVESIKMFLMTQTSETESLLYGKIAFWAQQLTPTPEIPQEKIYRSAMLRDLMNNGIEELDPSNPALMNQVLATINYYVQTGDLSQATADALLSSFYTPTTWNNARLALAESLGIPGRNVSSQEVAEATPYALEG